MVKSIGYQGRFLEEVYSENQILAMALSLFRKIDDVDLSIIKAIIARKLNLSTKKQEVDPKLHEPVALLPDDIKIEEKEYGNGSIGYSYYSPTVDKTKRDIEESRKYFERIGLQMSEKLFLAINLMADGEIIKSILLYKTSSIRFRAATITEVLFNLLF